MPKIKTHRGLYKRIKKRTASGKLKRAKAFSSHLKTSKSKKRKRQLKKPAYVSKVDKKRVETLLPYI